MRGRKLFLLLPFLASGCSLKGLALRSTAAIVDDGASALYEEADPELARGSVAAQLKLLEVLLRNDPGNARLLQRAAEGFCGYAFLFLDDTAPARAKGLYIRGRDFALRALSRDKKLAGLGSLELEPLQAALAQAGPEDAPALFWAGFGWASFINLSKDNSAVLAELPKAVAIMERVLALDPSYNFAGADLFFGVYYASRPAILGGDVKKSRAHFQEARRRTAGKYLMNYILEARYLAVAQQDLEAFQGLLSKVQEAPAGTLANARLADEVAKQKATQLMEKADDLF